MSYCLPWSPEETAKRFYDAYETLAPRFRHSARFAPRKEWYELDESMRALMIATVRAVLIEQVATLDGGER